MALLQEEREFLWKAYVELGVMENNFTNIQLRCRAFASTWILAAIAAVGFIFTSNTGSKALPPDLMIFIVGTIASIGMLVMWMIDLILYQRLLDAAFLEGLSMEKALPWLPHARINRRELLKGAGLGKLRNYYAIGFLFSLSIGIYGLAGYTCIIAVEYDAMYLTPLIPIIYGLIFIAAMLKTFNDTGSTMDYESRILTERENHYANFEQYRKSVFSDAMDETPGTGVDDRADN